jgi:PAS domain S-box-containing protein
MANHDGASAPLLLAQILVDESSDALIALTLDGHVRFWNRGADAMFGHTAGEAQGCAFDALTISEDRRANVRQALGTALRDGTSTLESVGRRKDGSLIAISLSMRRCEVPEGSPFLAVCTRDLSRLKRLQDQQAIDQKFRALLDAAPDAMVIVNRRGTIAIVNAQAEQIFGYQREELVGQLVDVLVPARFRADHPARRDGYFASPQPRALGVGLDLFGRRKDGTEFPIEISLSPIQTDEGTLVLSAIRDISHRKQLERRMQEASRLKGEFLANMSHELRTPLNAIIGFAELMHRGKAGPISAVHREYLGDILSSSQHLLQLINDILDLAKVESGKMELRPETVDLASLLGEVRDVVRGLAVSKRLRLETHVDSEVATVTVDPGRVKQILYNYLSNAIKFTPEEGRVEVRILPEGPELFRIDVEDTGVGIAPEQLGSLFLEFQQLDGGPAKRYQGTGLGLALTKQLAEAHGGRVAVRSTPGQGSVFSAILPRVLTLVPMGEHAPVGASHGA